MSSDKSGFELKLAWLAACVLLAACGVSERKVHEDTNSVAGSGGTSAGGDEGGASVGGKTTNNSSGSGGEAGESGSTGDAGESGSAGEAGSAGATNPGCVNDSLRCDDSSTPSKCVAGVWIPQAPCPAAKPVCSNGVCAAATLSGGIVTVSDGVLSTSTVRLAEHGLEYTGTTCGTLAAQKVCVTGGIRP